MCGCATHLISHDLYEEFVRPQDERVAALFPRGAMLHLCGSHAQHLPSWSGMEGICAFQLNDRAMDDLAAFYQESRGDQMLYLLPTKRVTAARALELTEGGRRSVICIAELERRAGRLLTFAEAQGEEIMDALEAAELRETVWSVAVSDTEEFPSIYGYKKLYTKTYSKCIGYLEIQFSSLQFLQQQ